MNGVKKPLRRSTNKENNKELKDAESGIPLRTMESIIDSRHMFFSQEDFQSWCEEMWTASETKQKIKVQLSNTSLLLLDYFQFKAARTIQKYLRRWYYARIYQRKRSAAIRIQYEWRKFYKLRAAYRKLEQETQETAEKFYFRQAQKIQALWRGWFTRQNIHDHKELMKSQVMTAEDLLFCIAFKLHHMLRTYQIPGVYSLRNSHCLSKVEKLLAAMTFKQHNKCVRQLRAKLEKSTNNARTRFEESTFNSVIPFTGPNARGLCEQKCADLQKSKDLDRRMYKILNMFEQAAKAETRKQRRESHTRGKEQKAQSPRSRSKQRKLPPAEEKTDFCEDIVASMKRWNILKENNVTVDPNIFRRPDLLEKFLHEIESIYNTMQDRCHCRIPEDMCH
ncbi:uncharacterized protein LOC129242660 isoform X1 [Anastrepha obliqua]|uniref:uncharacterized protein LOC129242660 isoform X1 n=1 Tax=Anastrepha obliqua TaxID=95512 RepID=UPI00240A776F|nr:uncharacterized protein LOC129242660 isoform X1 [Anastrepha obliqua]